MKKETFLKKLDMEGKIKYKNHKIKKCWGNNEKYWCVGPGCSCTQPIDWIWNYLSNK